MPDARPVARPVAADYDLTLREAEKALAAAHSADDIRTVWKKYNATLGHRTLGRLLTGASASAILAKRESAAGD